MTATITTRATTTTTGLTSFFIVLSSLWEAGYDLERTRLAMFRRRRLLPLIPHAVRPGTDRRVALGRIGRLVADRPGRLLPPHEFDMPIAQGIVAALRMQRRAALLHGELVVVPENVGRPPRVPLMIPVRTLGDEDGRGRRGDGSVGRGGGRHRPTGRIGSPSPAIFRPSEVLAVGDRNGLLRAVQCIRPAIPGVAGAFPELLVLDVG